MESLSRYFVGRATNRGIELGTNDNGDITDDSHRLYYSANNGYRWTDTLITDGSRQSPTVSSPALVWHNDALYHIGGTYEGDSHDGTNALPDQMKCGAWVIPLNIGRKLEQTTIVVVLELFAHSRQCHTTALYLIGGADTQEVWHSGDGENWELVDTSLISGLPGKDAIAVTYKGRLYIIGGRSGANYITLSRSVFSYDGQTWATKVAFDFPISGGGAVVTF